MKAFVAILLVAAVSGQYYNGGVDKSLWDLIRYRNTFGTYGDRTAYPFGTYGDRTAYPFGTYGDRATYAKYLQQAMGKFGGVEDMTSTGYFPYGQYNVPSDVYNNYLTIGQLYASPIFQQYLTLPLFRQYISYPAFQRYVATGYFQQYYTQAVFQQFFKEPALFYRYIYPIVAQFQTVGSYEPVISVPEVYRQYVPEYVYNYVNSIVSRGGVDTPFFGGRTYPTAEVAPWNWNKYFGGYSWEKLSTLGQNYPYNYNFDGVNSVYGNELNRRVQYPTTFDKYFNYPKNWYNTNTYYTGVNKNVNWENTPATYTPTWALDKIVKELIEGKVDVNEYVKNVVDPVTGGVTKVVEEKIVKPLDTTTLEGELTKNALHKVMLKNEVFNKL